MITGAIILGVGALLGHLITVAGINAERKREGNSKDKEQ